MSRTQPRRVVTIALVAGAVVAAVAIMALRWGGASERRGTDEPVSPSMIVNASWYAMDVTTTVTTAEAIAIGRVDGRQWTSRGVQMSDQGRAHARSLGNSDERIDEMVVEDRDMVFTHSTFHIERVLKGESVLAGDMSDGTIELHQYGGEFRGWRVEARDYPQLRPGALCVVFMGRSYDGTWGPMLVFTVKSGTASSSEEWLIGPNEYALEELLALIEAYKDAPMPWATADRDTPGPEGAAEPDGSGLPTAPPGASGSGGASVSVDPGATQ